MDKAIANAGADRAHGWLTVERVKLYSAAIFIAQALVFLLAVFWDPSQEKNAANVGNDFRVFWAASYLGLEGHGLAAYDFARLYPVQQSIAPFLHEPKAWYCWFYPPTFLLAVLPLALLPYKLSFFLFDAAGVAVYLGAMRKLVPWRAAVLPALAFPAVTISLFNGQNSFWTASLAALGLMLLDRRPRLAGVLIGLLVIKPQLALLFVPALACGRRWQTLAIAAVSAIAGFLASLLVFSPQAAVAFLKSVQLAKSLGETGALVWIKSITVFSTARQFGLDAHAANLLHALVALSVAVVVARIWWRGAPAHLRNSALMIGCLLISPHIFDYDLLWLAFPIAWLAMGGIREGWLPWERPLLVAAWISPFACNAMSWLIPTLWPLVSLLLLAHVAWRVRVAGPAKCAGGAAAASSAHALGLLPSDAETT
jgi:hypothetical protein